MSTLRTIKLKNSAQRGVRILFLSENKELAETIEAKSEIDPAFQRIDVFSAASASEARDMVRRHAIDLAIFPDGIDGKDFVALQLELRHARPEIEMIALIDIPSVSQLRESRDIGGIVDFEKKSFVQDFDSFKSLVTNYLRGRQNTAPNLSELYKFVSTLQACLLIDHAPWKEIKNVSSAITNHFVVLYDISSSECAMVIAAERLFFPWIALPKYSEVIPDTHPELAEILANCGAWEGGETTPKSPAGFIVTAANFLAKELISGRSVQELVELTERRPISLKHPSIKVLEKGKLKDILSAVTSHSLGGKKYAGA